MRLFELHPTDSRTLEAHFAAAGKRVQMRTEDGFAALKSLLPPPTRRAVVLIDPPYEVKSDYDVLVRTLENALRRFASGCYIRITSYNVCYTKLLRRALSQLNSSPASFRSRSGKVRDSLRASTGYHTM